MSNVVRNQVVLVNEKDEVLGVMEKLKAHQEGVLHRAFSLFVFNKKGEILLQQRADSKYHGGGLWTNTCCSHPQLDEEVRMAAKERLFFEMGLKADPKSAFSFIYKGKVENDLIEHELDHVLVAYSDEDPQINPEEVQNFRWVSPHLLITDIKEQPQNYTIWFKECLPEVLTFMKL